MPDLPEVVVCRDWWKEYGGNSGLVRMPGGRWRRVKRLDAIRKPGWTRYQGPVTAAMQRALDDREQPTLDVRVEFAGQLIYPKRAASRGSL